jgi:hypothetical protein
VGCANFAKEKSNRLTQQKREKQHDGNKPITDTASKN